MNRFAGWFIGTAALVVTSASCTLLVGTFEGPGGTGTSTQGGGGSTGPGGTMGSTSSTMTTSTMTSMSMASTSSGPDGGPGGCKTAAECGIPPSPCLDATCENGVCGTKNKAPGTVLKMDSPADCQDTVCDGNGGTTMAPDLQNVPASPNPCVMGICNSDGTPGTMVLGANTACTPTSGSGKLCDGAGSCVECLANKDCPSGQSCTAANTCVPASCTNGIQDPGETDIDCGGGTCNPCADTKKCTKGPDCTSKVCSQGACAKPSCSDGQQNGNETAIDCGGGAPCSPCGPNLTCKVASDCAGGACGGGTCTPNCKDGTLNNNETDLDCGGGCPGCGVGKICKIDPDCANSACDPTTNRCVSDQCADHRLDGSETDLDCGGSCPHCPLGSKCKGNGDCTTNACNANSALCVANQCVDAQVDGNESDVDCGGSCSTKCGMGKKCMSNADCATNACDATAFTCDSSQCADGKQDGAETGTDCGGGTCPKCPVNGGCTVDADCTTAACNPVTHKCASNTCTDQKIDGAETDVDCGGGTCPACAQGKTCATNADCTSNACNASTATANPNTCVSSQCADAKKDGLETDIDCGGGSCNPCPNGKGCGNDLDCTSQACDANTNTCIANQCADHRIDGMESDIDCGGLGGCVPCLSGKKCNSSSDCQSGHTCTTTTPHVCN